MPEKDLGRFPYKCAHIKRILWAWGITAHIGTLCPYMNIGPSEQSITTVTHLGVILI